jgi:hypothetical protein
MKFHAIAKAALTLSLLAAPCLAQAPRAAQEHFSRGGSLYIASRLRRDSL